MVKKTAPKRAAAAKKAVTKRVLPSKASTGRFRTPANGLGRQASLARATERTSSRASSMSARATKAQPADLADDGRRLRAARNYEAVLNAVLQMAQECPPEQIYLPSAAEVAARAGVSERTVFRHFADLETLFIAAASKIKPIQDAGVIPRPDAADLAVRIAELVRLRSKLYEEITPLRRVAVYLSATHPILVQQLQESHAATRAQVADVFARELSRVETKRRTRLLDGLDLALGWTSWNNLRAVQHCSVPRSREIVTEIATDLLATVPKAKRR